MAQAQQGLFGMTPFDANMLRRQDIMESAKGIEQYGPGFAAGVLAQQGIGQIGRSFGLRDQYDEQADKTTQVKQWLKENLPENPDPIQYYEKMAEAFNRFGMPEQAAQVMLKVDDLKNSDVDRKHKLSDIDYNNMQAQSNALKAKADWAKVLQDAKLKPSDIKTMAEMIQRNPDMEKRLIDKYPEFKDILNSVNTGPAFSEPYINQMGDLVQRRLSGPDKGQEVEVSRRDKISFNPTNITKFPETDFNREYFATTNKKAEEEYGKVVPTIKQMQQAVPELEKIIKSGVMNTGALAGLKTEVGNVLVSLGIDAGKLTDAVSSDQVYDSLVGDQVLAKMQQLGGNDSNEELREIRKMTMDRRKTPQALETLLNVLKRKLNYYKRIEQIRMQGLKEGRIGSFYNPQTGIWYPDRELEKGTLSVEDFSEEEIQKVMEITRPDGTKPTREQAIKALRNYWGL